MTEETPYTAQVLPPALAGQPANLAEAETTLTEAMTIIRREYGRASRNAVSAFAALMGAVSRRDPARAAMMIEQERQALASGATALSPAADLRLRGSEIANHWIAGDMTAAAAVALPDEANLLAPTAIRDNEVLLIHRVRALIRSGRAAQGLQLMQTLQSQWPDRNVPTLSWLRIQETLAEAQLAADQPGAAGATAGDLMRMLEQQHASASRAYLAAASLGALAAVRRGDRDEAVRLLDGTAKAAPPFASPAERADCVLRRAEALVELGRVEDGAALARAVLRTLDGQHRDSPRAAMATRLVARAASAAGAMRFELQGLAIASMSNRIYPKSAY